MPRFNWQRVDPGDLYRPWEVTQKKGGPYAFARYKVIDPRPVLRVGYPFDVKARVDELLTAWGVPLNRKLLAKADLFHWWGDYHPRYDKGVFMYDTPAGKLDGRAAWELARTLAAHEGRRCGFGGNERRVRLGEPIEALRGAEVVTIGVRSVREGTREYVGPEEGVVFNFEKSVKLVKVAGPVPSPHPRHGKYIISASNIYEFPESHLEPVFYRTPERYRP